MDLSFNNPGYLLLGPLSLVPFFLNNRQATRYSSLIMLPKDWLSSVFFGLIKLTSASAILLLVLGLAEPHYPQRSVKKTGTGAHIVLLLDRSASMNENFSGRYFGGSAKESKVSVARKLLTELVRRRENDFFGLIFFSTTPIHVLPLSQDKQAVISAINAANTRGRGVTNIAPGLAMALEYFIDQPVTGSRVILLVSDGAARIDEATQTTLTQLFKLHKVMLYWIYLRNKSSASLTERPANANETTTPEYFLHQYFLGMGVPYRAFEAQNPRALQQAIAEIEKLENKPIQYALKVPRQSLVNEFYGWAILGLVFLLLIRWLELRTGASLSKKAD